MLNTVAIGIVAGLVSLGLGQILRAAPIVPLEWRARKPLSCDLCLGFWTALCFAAYYRNVLVLPIGVAVAVIISGSNRNRPL